MTLALLSPHIELSPTWRILLAAASCGAGVSPAVPPFPHARKKPNITLPMLQALKVAYDSHNGRIIADSGTCQRLVNRGLVRECSYPLQPTNRHVITGRGRILIRTQYAALLKVLTNDLTAGN